MHVNFPVQWMKIMKDITQLHELSEQPTYTIVIKMGHAWESNPD